MVKCRLAFVAAVVAAAFLTLSQSASADGVVIAGATNQGGVVFVKAAGEDNWSGEGRLALWPGNVQRVEIYSGGRIGGSVFLVGELPDFSFCAQCGGGILMLADADTGEWQIYFPGPVSPNWILLMSGSGAVEILP